MLRAILWTAVVLIGGYLLAASVVALWSSRPVKQPNRKEFQRLLSANGGWHGIQWFVDSGSVYCSVTVKHEIDGETYEFHVSRARGAGMSERVSRPGWGTIWKREEKSGEGHLTKVPPPHAFEHQATLERLADEIWDAFAQGETSQE
jgi:hypothetical protein